MLPPTSDSRPSPESVRLLQLEAERQSAREHRRRLMQGLGRPILSAEVNGYRLVWVGGGCLWSKKWRTFHDFLLSYITHVLTKAWADAEFKKDETARHLLIRWYEKLCAYQNVFPRHRPRPEIR